MRVPLPNMQFFHDLIVHKHGAAGRCNETAPDCKPDGVDGFDSTSFEDIQENTAKKSDSSSTRTLPSPATCFVLVVLVLVLLCLICPNVITGSLVVFINILTVVISVLIKVISLLIGMLVHVFGMLLGG